MDKRRIETYMFTGDPLNDILRLLEILGVRNNYLIFEYRREMTSRTMILEKRIQNVTNAQPEPAMKDMNGCRMVYTITGTGSLLSIKVIFKLSHIRYTCPI